MRKKYNLYKIKVNLLIERKQTKMNIKKDTNKVYRQINIYSTDKDQHCTFPK